MLDIVWYTGSTRNEVLMTETPKQRAMRSDQLRYKYGLTVEQFDSLLASQAGVCAACGEPETARYRTEVRRLSVDHDHKTGAVRGLLCHSCNVALGLLGEDIVRITALAAYLAPFQDR